MINVGNLLFAWYAIRLAEKSGEDQGFPHGRGTFMNIHLFAVAGGALETDTLWPTIDQDGSVDLTTVLALSQYIEQSLSISFASLCHRLIALT